MNNTARKNNIRQLEIAFSCFVPGKQLVKNFLDALRESKDGIVILGYTFRVDDIDKSNDCLDDERIHVFITHAVDEGKENTDGVVDVTSAGGIAVELYDGSVTPNKVQELDSEAFERFVDMTIRSKLKPMKIFNEAVKAFDRRLPEGIVPSIEERVYARLASLVR